MAGLLALSAGIDKLSRAFGMLAAVFVLLSCMISAGNALSRYALNISANSWLEIQWQMFAAIFLLGSAYVLQLNEHVRVDMVYGGLPARGKLWIDVFGLLFFLFPATALMFWFGVPWFVKSYLAGEMSSNAGGLPVWPVKLLLPLGFALLFLQGISELIKRIAALRGIVTLTVTYEKPLK